ncbi:MAG: amidohydrolase family protein [Rhodospirillaceae bacterium]
MDSGIEPVKENPIKEITTYTDSRDILAKARKQADKNNFDDVFIADIDAHHVETESWRDIIGYIDDDVVRENAKEMVFHRSGTPPYGINGDLALRYQDVGGRIPHQAARSEKIDPEELKGTHRDVILARRSYEAMGINKQVIFPTPMLFLGMHPQFDMEAILGKAYNRWTAEHILAKDENLKSMMFLPFNDPESALETIEEFGDTPGCVGFMVTSVRYKAVHHNHYMKVYRALEERGLPLGFHAGYYWQDPFMMQINRFASMHALSFVWCNVVHMTNWIMNGLPERFPNLPVVWIESGLAWVPWLMQRLDHTYLMRSSEAPLLKKLPSEYMKEMFYTCQPLETDHPKAVELTFEMINAKEQLLYASDWPHYDFDTPSVIWDLPFLDEQAKRNILGLNAKRIFNFDR